MACRPEPVVIPVREVAAVPSVVSEPSVFPALPLPGSRASSPAADLFDAEPSGFAKLLDKETDPAPQPKRSEGKPQRDDSTAKESRGKEDPAPAKQAKAPDSAAEAADASAQATDAQTQASAETPAAETPAQTAPAIVETPAEAVVIAATAAIPQTTEPAKTETADTKADTGDGTTSTDAAVDALLAAAAPSVTPATPVAAPVVPVVTPEAANTAPVTASAETAPIAEPAAAAPAQPVPATPIPVTAAPAAPAPTAPANDAEAAPAAPEAQPVTQPAAQQVKPQTPEAAKTKDAGQAPAKPATAPTDAVRTDDAPARPERVTAPREHGVSAELAPEASPESKPDPVARPHEAANAVKAGADLVQTLNVTAPAPQAHSAPLQSTAAANAVAAATPTPMQSPPVPVAGLAVEIAAQSLAGKNRFEIRLDPPELGRIDVRLEIDNDGHVKSRLIVERSETLDMLRRDAPQLERALQQAGLKTADNALEFSLRQHAPQRDNEPNQNTPRLIVPDENAGTLDAVQHNYGRRFGLGGGIDIRV